MDVPLALNDIGIRHGLKGYTRKSSTFSLQTDVVGLSACISLFGLSRFFFECGLLLIISYHKVKKEYVC